MSATVDAAVRQAKRWRQGSNGARPGPREGSRKAAGLSLEPEVELGGLAVFDRDLAAHRLQLLVVSLDLVLAGRQALDLVCRLLLEKKKKGRTPQEVEEP